MFNSSLTDCLQNQGKRDGRMTTDDDDNLTENNAGVVSSAFKHAVKWSLVAGEPSACKRAARTEEAAGDSAHTSTAASADRCSDRDVIFEYFPEDLCRNRGAPRRGAGASLVGHPGWSCRDYALTDADQGRSGVQRNQDPGQRAAGEPAAVSDRGAGGASSSAE
jgi:hypothetical protein